MLHSKNRLFLAAALMMLAGQTFTLKADKSAVNPEIEASKTHTFISAAQKQDSLADLEKERAERFDRLQKCIEDFNSKEDLDWDRLEDTCRSYLDMYISTHRSWAAMKTAIEIRTLKDAFANQTRK